mgnify:CR=1 FL=1
MSLSNYNRNRPFLVVTRHISPSAGAKTETKNWAKVGRMVVNENVIIADKVSKRHMAEATVIVDLFNKKLVKNRINDSNDDEVVNHYLNAYNEQISSGINMWIKKKLASTPNAGEELIAGLEGELESISKENE